MNKLRVYLADDHPVVRNGLRALLEEQDDIEVVGEAADGSTAVRGALELRPDVVIMDLSMPGTSGAEATRLLRAGCPEVRVVALTAHEDRAYLQQAVGAGASGYVLKRTAAVELLGAIRHAAAGNTYFDPVIAGQLVAAAGAPPESDGAPALSDREEEVLKGIARGYSNKQIAAQLKVSVKTVETYKSRGMEKLGARSRVDLVRLASARGWLAGT